MDNLKEKLILGSVGLVLSGGGAFIAQSVDAYSDLSDRSRANEVMVARVSERVKLNHELLISNSKKIDRVINKIDQVILNSLK